MRICSACLCVQCEGLSRIIGTKVPALQDFAHRKNLATQLRELGLSFHLLTLYQTTKPHPLGTAALGGLYVCVCTSMYDISADTPLSTL